MSGKKNNQKNAVKLSLSMIIKNEEKFLEGCLESVKGIVDEIVIVDTGSMDASKEIAARFGAKVFDFAWVGDFSAARNFALRQCTGSWILYLDADERFAENQTAALHKLTVANGVGAYNVVIKNPHSLQQGNVNQENSYPRLFRNVPGVQFEGKVHEQVWHSLVRQRLTIKQSSLVIHHLGYDQGYDVVKQKAERNLELLRHQLAENPADAYAQFQIGNSLVVLQRYDEAKPVLELALANVQLDKSNRASCYNLLAEIEVKKGNSSGAVELCLKSLQLAPKQLMAHWFLSLLYFDLHEYSKALDVLVKIKHLLHVPSAQRSNQVASDLNLKKEDIYKRLALTFEAAGQYNAAMVQYVRVLELTQASEEAFVGFLRCVEKVDDSRAAIEGLLSLTRKLPERKELLLPLAWHYRKLDDLQSALMCIDQTIQAQPMNAIAYAFAARWRMELGELSEAEAIIAAADSRNLRAFDLHKCGMELSLRTGNVNSAFHYFDLMTQTTTADLSPLKNRISVLAERISKATRL